MITYHIMVYHNSLLAPSAIENLSQIEFQRMIYMYVKYSFRNYHFAPNITHVIHLYEFLSPSTTRITLYYL